MDPSRAGVSIPFAARMAGIGDSRSQGLIARVRALRAAGADVIDFGQQGPPPRVAVEAARAGEQGRLDVIAATATHLGGAARNHGL